jgi:hypothetical protein
LSMPWCMFFCELIVSTSNEYILRKCVERLIIKKYSEHFEIWLWLLHDLV